MVLPAWVMFTARSENGTSLDVVAQFTINYKAALPGITPPHSNPDIAWVGICAVPDRFALGFDFFAGSGHYKMIYLYNKNHPTLCDSVIDVDTGYAYFLVSDNAVAATIDSAGQALTNIPWDTIRDNNGNMIAETYAYKWFYQNIDNVTDQDDSLMQIDDNESACIEMKPPDNIAMKRFRAWVAVYDQNGSQWRRPRGMCVRAVSGIFRFSPEYIRMESGQ